MDTVEKITSQTEKEKRGIKYFNSLLKINEYTFANNLQAFKQSTEKNHYSESFIYNRVGEDRMTFTNQMIGAINILQMAELITEQESENMLIRVQEQAEIIKNRYFPPAECKEKNKAVSDNCSISVKENISDKNPVETLQLGITGTKKCKRKMKF